MAALTPAAGFPGLYRPGLIEVPPARCAAVSVSRCFRGFIAPASLKFYVAFTIAVSPRRFPGLYRPGLIEVALPVLVVVMMVDVSGALSPRPH